MELLYNLPNFKLLPFITLKAILRSDYLSLTEEAIWDNCLLWAKHQFDVQNSIVNSLDVDSTPQPPENRKGERKEGR